ncbi:MAG TPA: hypothetical protein VFU02_21645 [Polyangiaceae bacterium]|nr:hypothetical protein [Polyangiaceae bacterium]
MNAPSHLTSRAPRQFRLVTPGWKKPTRSALAFALAGFVLLLACSRQGEGDRCSTENDDNDCESGLICIEARDLRGGSDEVPRCCPPDGEAISDGRCTRLIGGGSTTTGGGGQAGESSVATNTTGGSCTHTSQCPTDLVCGPQGLCQPECLEDRDCTAPLICSSNNRCVSR